MHSLPFGNGVAAGCCCQWCNDRRNDLRDGCLVRCNLKILVSIHDLRVWHSKLKDAWGSASWQGMIVKTSSCFAFWTRSGIFQSNLLFEDWVWDNSEWKQKVDMGPATVCSCEHRSTNVPVLSFHKLSRDLVQLARERWLMMGWWDGKKRSENSDVTEERLCF